LKRSTAAGVAMLSPTRDFVRRRIQIFATSLLIHACIREAISPAK
jgi:hypothetical protein